MAALALAAGAAAASPAIAATHYVGEQSTFYVCVVAPTVGTGTRTLCINAGGDTCQPVDVPVPTVTGQADVFCGGEKLCSVIDPSLGICEMFSPNICWSPMRPEGTAARDRRRPPLVRNPLAPGSGTPPLGRSCCTCAPVVRAGAA